LSTETVAEFVTITAVIEMC